jgi:hypothetical protein
MVKLAANAEAGDIVTTVMTRPDGSTVTLTILLKASDVASGQISQQIAAMDLAADGNYSASTTVTDIAGNQSAPTRTIWSVDGTPPGAPTIDLPEAPNGVERQSDGGTPLVITLPTGLVVGDVIKTVVTKPDNSTVTLISTLTAADLTAGKVTQVVSEGRPGFAKNPPHLSLSC